MAGCTQCGSKDACDHRKGDMMAAVGEALDRLYPSRCWGKIDAEASFAAGITAREGRLLASILESRLAAKVVYKVGTPMEYCDYVYVLCVGRPPCLAELEETGAPPPAELSEGQLHEQYLRICLSHLARMATVQQVTMRLDHQDGEFVIREAPRSGVFDPPLLPRMQKLVAVLPQMEIVSVDFGDISAPPEGFDPGNYAARYSGVPDTANYLFYPQPTTTETTRLLRLAKLAPNVNR